MCPVLASFCLSAGLSINDFIEDKKRFEKLPLERTFDADYMERDLVSFTEPFKRDLYKKVRLLRESGMDPKGLTYKEIVRFVKE